MISGILKVAFLHGKWKIELNTEIVHNRSYSIFVRIRIHNVKIQYLLKIFVQQLTEYGHFCASGGTSELSKSAWKIAISSRLSYCRIPSSSHNALTLLDIYYKQKLIESIIELGCNQEKRLSEFGYSRLISSSHCKRSVIFQRSQVIDQRRDFR
jgi:hypothetical protein